MAVRSSYLSFFPHLENIKIEAVATWLKHTDDLKFVENEVGNRILYPDTVPVVTKELLFDLALLREILKADSEKYFSPNLKRIYLPQNLLERFPDLLRLIWIFVDVLKPQAITSIIEKTEGFGSKSLGTLIRPKVNLPKNEVTIFIKEKKYRVKASSLVVIPAPESKVDIKIELEGATLLGKSSYVAEVAGGEVGIIVDTRIAPS